MRAQVSGKLLATVAASAATVTSAGIVAAHAADAQDTTDQTVIDSRIKIAFEGAGFWNNVGDDKLSSDKLGSTDGAFFGSIALTKQISPDMDWSVAGAFQGKDRSFNVSEPVSGGTLDISSGDSFDFQTFDFDVGKHVKVQTADIRFFGGLRLVHSEQEIKPFSLSFTPTDPTAGGGSFEILRTNEFWGIGPRVGAEAYYPLNETWGLTGAVSGAVMWGRRSDRLAENSTNTNPASRTSVTLESQSSNETVTNVDASAGLSWTPLQNTTFTAGYKVEVWHNLLTYAEHTNQVFHGPFLRLEVKM